MRSSWDITEPDFGSPRSCYLISRMVLQLHRVILKNVGHFLLRSIATPGQRCDFALKNKKKEGHKWKKPADIGKIYTLFENFVLYWIITPN